MKNKLKEKEQGKYKKQNQIYMENPTNSLGKITENGKTFTHTLSLFFSFTQENYGKTYVWSGHGRQNYS